MSADEIRQRNEAGRAAPVSAALGSYPDETDAWSSGDVLRLFVAPVVVTALLVGGVYWIRMQLPSGSAGQQATSIMQVQLLPRPVAVPMAVASLSQPITTDASGRVDAPVKEPDPTASDDPVPVPRARTLSPADTPPSNVMATPSSVNGPANSEAAKFQQALLRHVARYQRYPSGARPLRLEGKVDTQFVMSRDGTLLGVWVKTSSGQVMLDKEAIETIRRAQPLPPIPPELPDRLNIHVQLEFDPS